MSSPILQRMLTAQTVFESQLLSKPNVVGVAVGLKESEGIVTDELAVVVLVQEKKPYSALSAAEIIPREVGGVRTDVLEVGYLRAQQTAKSEFRPVIPSGVSIGHYKITAGTLGTMVTDKVTGERYILSNNHVLANSNDAIVNDAVLQPGPLDGGTNPEDLIARLVHFTPLRYLEDANKPTDPDPKPDPKPDPNAPGCNIVGMMISLTNFIASLTGNKQRAAVTAATAVGAQSAASAAASVPVVAQAPPPDNAYDAALAKPINPAMFSNEIFNVGRVTGTKSPTLGMTVRKSGRTTGVTDGVITLLNATVNVAYDTREGTKTARFTGQVITQAMSQGGDSGSLVFDPTDNKAVGLLFAGSSVATIFTPIDVVLAGFKSAGFDLEI